MPVRVVPFPSFVRSRVFVACRIVFFQEEPDYGFHPWALANGIECGGGDGGKSMASDGRAGGEEGMEEEEWNFDYDEDVEDIEVGKATPAKRRTYELL